MALGCLAARETARAAPAANGKTRVRVWCEGTAPASVYPDDVDGVLCPHLGELAGMEPSRSRLDDPDAGVSDELLDQTDVLVWWGRLRHDELSDDRAQAIAQRVRDGSLGLVALHASFASKPFRILMDMHCRPQSWRMDGRPEVVSVNAPDHPIAEGVAPFTIPLASSFGEPFLVPNPETVVLVSRWENGDSFRSCLTWTVGKGRVVYFRPGHDAFPVLFHPEVKRVIGNAVRWAHLA